MGITFIFVTHDQEEALTLSDRVAVMARGDVLQMASPQQLYNHPVNVEVADFIGQMNFFDARVVDLQDGQAVLDTEGLGQLQVSAEGGLVIRDGRIVVALRPEKLLLSGQANPDHHGSVRGELTTSAYLGNRSQYYVMVDGCEHPVEVAGQESGLNPGLRLERGSEVWLSWAEESLVLLPVPEGR